MNLVRKYKEVDEALNYLEGRDRPVPFHYKPRLEAIYKGFQKVEAPNQELREMVEEVTGRIEALLERTA